MRYASASAFRAALEASINRTAARDARSIQHLRKMAVFERLLARLAVVAPERWVVKGGVALDLRLGDRARATRDLDLARDDAEAAAMEDLLAATEHDLGDFFVFTAERTSALDRDREQAAVRYHVRAELAGRRFEEIALDIGFGDPLPASPDHLPGPGIFTFAELPPITVPTLPLEQHIAQKLHAYTRAYAEGRPSTRVKDLIDMVLIRSAAAFNAGRLREELARTFAARGTHDLPIALPPPPEDWTVPYRALALEVGLDPELACGHALAASLLDRVLAGLLDAAVTWSASEEQWLPAGDGQQQDVGQ